MSNSATEIAALTVSELCDSEKDNVNCKQFFDIILTFFSYQMLIIMPTMVEEAIKDADEVEILESLHVASAPVNTTYVNLPEPAQSPHSPRTVRG